MSKIQNRKRFKKLLGKCKKVIEQLHLEIDQATNQNKKYILHIAQIQEDLKDLEASICEKNKQLRILNDKLLDKS